MNYKIMLVDDEPANLRILERLFRAEYNVVTAESGAEALELLGQHDIALIISDQRMPVMTGIDFLKKAAEMRPHTVRIILTGYTDVNALVEAINSGVVYKYATKPWVNEDLQQTVRRAVQHYETIKAQHGLKLQNERLERRQQATFDNFVKIVVRLLDLKEPDLQNHVRQTAESAVTVGQKLNLPLAELKQISVAALLHEFAHVGVPNQIIDKVAELNEQQRQLLTKNFERELDLLASVPDLEDIVSVIRAIDERFDGSGFPDALAGEQIPLHTRIIAVADAYEEMIFRRGAQPNLTHAEALTRLASFAGNRFDPEIVEIFCELKTNGSFGEAEIRREMSLVE